MPTKESLVQAYDTLLNIDQEVCMALLAVKPH
jgi:hypothetical protein